MEKLIINIPDKKIALVKQVLQGLGIDIHETANVAPKSDYRKKISEVSIWSDQDVKELENGKDAFNSLKIDQW